MVSIKRLLRRITMEKLVINEPLTLKCGVTLKNKLIMAPMTTKMSYFDGVITTDELNYYALRSGEVGAVITAAANVQEIGKGWEGELGVYSDIHLDGLSKLASTIKKKGTKAILQIFHAGRMTDNKILRGEQPVAPSAVKAERPDAIVPRELSESEILQLIEDFKRATVRAIKAGFDGVEIHGANTFLIQQFFSPHSNRTSDRWGGSVEKRFTFINQLVDSIIHTVNNYAHAPFIVGYRFSPEEHETPGIRFKDTLYLVKQLANKNIDYLHVSLNDYKRISMSHEYKEKTILEYIHETINEKVPLIGIGDVRTREDAENVVQHSELIGLGRILLSEPHWVNKVLTNKENLIRVNISQEDREELVITNGVWGFLEDMMPERLI